MCAGYTRTGREKIADISQLQNAVLSVVERPGVLLQVLTAEVLGQVAVLVMQLVTVSVFVEVIRSWPQITVVEDHVVMHRPRSQWNRRREAKLVVKNQSGRSET